MNFLGHSAISLKIDKNTLYGNFAGDFYKGTIESIEAPIVVKNGLKLHRKIDLESDNDNLVTKHVNKKFGLFRSVISDIYIDHFISLNWDDIYKSGKNLEASVKDIYGELDKYKEYYTEDFKMVYSWIKKENILCSYKEISGIRRTFIGISRRVRRGEILEEAVEELINNYDLYSGLCAAEYKRIENIMSLEYNNIGKV